MQKLCLLSLFAISAAWSGDLFPLQTGNSWTYRDRAGRQSLTIRVGTPLISNDRVYHSVSGYGPRRLLVRVNEANDLVYLDPERDTERLLTSFTPTERAWWEAPERQCDQEGQTLEKRGTHTGPAGQIGSVLEVRYRTFGCADAGVLGEQYAENIGMVQRTVSTIAGPVTMDLVQARVGNLDVEAPASGKFTVAVNDPPAGDVLTVTLRIRTSPSAPLKLTFPSSQEFDIVVRDLNDNVVYRWSADKVFLAALHDRTISGLWEATAEIPRPAQAGAYTVEGFLTTVSGPRFAAVVPATVAPAN